MKKKNQPKIDLNRIVKFYSPYRSCYGHSSAPWFRGAPLRLIKPLQEVVDELDQKELSLGEAVNQIKEVVKGQGIVEIVPEYKFIMLTTKSGMFTFNLIEYKYVDVN